jgi:hypothetical protein
MMKVVGKTEADRRAGVNRQAADEGGRAQGADQDDAAEGGSCLHVDHGHPP